MSENTAAIEAAGRAIQRTREFSAAAAFGVPIPATTSCAEGMARAAVAAAARHLIAPLRDWADALERYPEDGGGDVILIGRQLNDLLDHIDGTIQ